MKNYFFIIYTTLFVVLYACSPIKNMSNMAEDDIYYVPGEKALMLKEVEAITGVSKPAPQNNNAVTESQYDDYTPVINPERGVVENVSTQSLANEAVYLLEHNEEINRTIYENTGYWIGGFNGSTQDLREAIQIINRYPDGFGFASNGMEIAMNLSFDPDWNVYTDNGRFWWFPSPSNFDLYNTFVFGTYPKYVWAVAWNTPRYDNWAFNSHFGWGVGVSWNRPGWSIGIGWNYYDPWYNPWYYDRWYNHPWYSGHYPPHGYHPHHPHYPHHPGHNTPNYGGNIKPGNNMPSRPGTTVRPGTTTRPGSSVRPGSSTRPGVSTRPGATTSRPTTTTRPGATTVRPGSATRPGATTRPNATTRPSGTGSTYTRPSSTGTGNSNVKPGTGNVKDYNRNSSGNQRPAYNTRSTTTRSGSSYAPSSNRSSGSSSSTTNRSSGSSRSSGGSSGGSTNTRTR